MRKEVWFGLSIMAFVVVLVFGLMPPPAEMTNGHLGLLMLALIVIAIMLGSLLEAFYGSFAQSAPPAEALRAAQRAMIARSDYRAEPRYWASCFISSRGL